MKLLITCPFGLWSLLAQELKRLWFVPEETFQTWTFLTTDTKGMMKINYLSRLANKVYIQLATWEAKTFDELFNIVKHSDFSQFSSNTNISLKVEIKNSILSSTRTVQSVTHKAILENIAHFWKEETYTEELLLINTNNHVTLYINTSWKALYQRGYKKYNWEAPIKENLATALLLLSWRKFKSPLYDPFCWSWTLAIEAALLAKNKAPWSRRHFNFEHFKNYEKTYFETLKLQAKEKEFSWTYTIIASDISEESIKNAQENAKIAGVENDIQFKVQDFLSYNIPNNDKAWIITNPPYGKRITSNNLWKLYAHLEQSFSTRIYWWRISSLQRLSYDAKKRSQKKLFNWADECHFYRKKPN